MFRTILGWFGLCLLKDYEDLEGFYLYLERRLRSEEEHAIKQQDTITSLMEDNYGLQVQCEELHLDVIHARDEKDLERESHWWNIRAAALGRFSSKN